MKQQPAYIYLFLIAFNILFICNLFAQNKKREQEINPRIPMIGSAILPGTGQIINRQWWKVPFIYAGLGTSAYFAQYTYQNYVEFRDAYVIRTDKNPNTIDKYDPLNGTAKDRYSELQLKSIRDYNRKNLEISLLAFTGVYVLNVIDAYVGAHLRSFEKMKDISFNFAPIETSIPESSGFTFGLIFKY